ncbi:AraC family transcriptional regulator [Acidisarcina polymorpha]|uniref:AraC family transcriptional regulator n=1 Tax=Acidisarcina polymorpha TaxID=2211140 RepID=UPI000DEF28E2
MVVMRSHLAMAELKTDREPLRLSWSEAISGTELYDGENVETFATDWHFHEGWQLVAVTKGERHYQFKSSSIVARPGRLVLVPPRLVHRAQCLYRGKTSFKIATLPAVSLSVDRPAAPISWSTAKVLGQFITFFESLKSGVNCEPQVDVLPRLETILGESGARNALVSPAPPAFVSRMQSYLSHSLAKVPSLDALSSLAGVSPYYFVHAFTRHIGLSPLAFHTRARLIQSRKLISEGWSLADTSLHLRFSDQSHFGRQFRRVYGMTPGQYQHRIATGVVPRS